MALGYSINNINYGECIINTKLQLIKLQTFNLFCFCNLILGRYLGSFQPNSVNPFQFVPRNGLESWYNCWSKDGNYFIYSRGFGWISIANFKTASERMAKDSNIMDLFDNIDTEDSLAPDLSTLCNPSRAFIADYLTRLIRQRNKPGYTYASCTY